MTVLESQANTPFTAAAQTSPALLDPADAEKVTIPMAMLASKDEDAVAVKQFGENIKGRKFLRTYDGVHGFLSAR